MTKARFEISEDVEKCCKYLRDRKRITYAELSKELGRDIKKRDRYVLESARRRLEREGIVFVVETGVAVVRASDPQIASLSTEAAIDKTRRAAKRAKKREKIVNPQALSAEERTEFNIGRAVMGLLRQTVRTAVRNEITKAVNADSEGAPLDIAKTLSIFGKMRPNGHTEQ